MKKILVFIVALFLCSNVFSQGINFEHGTFAEALAKAKKENKMVFMDCYTSWCGPCKMMTKKIFPQKEVGEYFNAHFVNFKVDMEKGEGIELKNKYGVKAFPTLLFMDANGEVLHTTVGGSGATGLINQAKKAVDPTQRIAAKAKKYEEGNREPALVANYIDMLYKQFNNEKMKAVGTDYLSNLATKELLKKDNFDILLRVGAKYTDESYQYVKNNKEQFLKLSDEKTLERFLFGMYKSHLNQIAKGNNKKELDAALALFKKEYPGEKYKSSIDKYYSVHYLANKQFDKWFDFHEELVEEALKKDSIKGIYTIMPVVSQVARDPNFKEVKGASERAIKMIYKVKVINEKHSILHFYLAKLYMQIGKRNKALESVNAFIEKSVGSDKKLKLGNELKIEIEKM